MVTEEDKLWGETFAIKRESYGVSQNELAHVSKISRSLIAMIESGKRSISDDVKKNLSRSLEKLSPFSIMDIYIDYVRIRFPTDNTEDVIKKILGLRVDFFLVQEYGFYGYGQTLYFGDIFILSNSKDERGGVLLEMKGTGCRQFETYLKIQEMTWYDFFRKVLAFDGHMKRLDLAINDFVDVLQIDKLIEKCENDELFSKFRSYRAYKSGDFVSSREEMKAVMGSTLYIGSNKSEIYFCIYEKDYEQFVKKGIPLEETEIKNRFEIRLSNERAEQAVENLICSEDAEETAFGIINEYLCFIDSEDDKEKRDCPINEDWLWFLGNHRQKIKLTTAPKPYSVDDTIKWLYHQVAPTLKMIYTLDYYKGTDHVRTMVEDTELKKKQLKILEQMLTTAEDVVLKEDEEKEN